MCFLATVRFSYFFSDCSFCLLLFFQLNKKMKKVKSKWLFALLIGASVQGVAQSANDSTKQLNEVVITATKFPKSTHETGKVLTVIDRSQLQREEGKSLSQILNDQAGLVVNGANSNPGKDKSVFLQGADSKYTLILLDGIPIYDASGGGGAFDLRLLTTDQVERIEILKGSQSTLYGTDAIAGVINIISRKNGDSKIGGTASANYGTYQTFNANARVTGKIGKIGYVTDYSRRQSGGISEATDKKNAGFDRDGFFGNFFNLSLKAQPTREISITPFFRSAFFHGKFDDDSFTDNLTKAYHSKFYNYGVRLQLSLPESSVYLHLSQNTIDRQYSSSGGDSNFYGTFTQNEIFVNHKLGQHASLAGGANYQQMYVRNEKGAKNPSFNISSPYLALHLMKLRGFSAEIGGRYNYHSNGWSAFTYSLNPSYRIKESAVIFFNYSTGFKTPTLSDLYNPWGNENLKPEKSKSLEVGGQGFLKNVVTVRVVFFRRNVDDVIVFLTNKMVNVKSQKDWGIEVEPRVKVNDRITLSGFYAFVTGELSTTSPTTKKDTTYYNLLRRPKHSVGVNFTCQATDRISFNWSLKTFSERKDFFYNRVDYSTQPVNLSSYQLLDANISYLTKNKIASFFLSAKNILNQNYMEVYGYNVLRFTFTAGSTINF